MTMVIEWSMSLFDNDQQIVARRKNPVTEFYVHDPELFARDRARDFFDMDEWDKWFGMDVGEGDVIVEIFEPKDMRGKWKVNVELTVEATVAELIVEEAEAK